MIYGSTANIDALKPRNITASDATPVKVVKNRGLRIEILYQVHELC
jgi:hypothetical protein